MFLNKLLKENKELVETAIDFHQQGKILPDTFVIDVDTFVDNAKKILAVANKEHIELYFMLKQVGRNPYLAKKLVEIGYKGAVVVDFKEAQIMMDNNIPISNVGHLVQPPKAMIEKLINYGCEYFTVYSLEKTSEIDLYAKKKGLKQKILIRVVGDDDVIYSGQTAGIKIKDLNEFVEKALEMENIEIAGVTSFPCYLYDDIRMDIGPTNNLKTVFTAVEKLKSYGIDNININTPSTTCCATLNKMASTGATSGEPGHGFTGTTPLHAQRMCEEKQCVLYLSEVSHNYMSHAFCYGGGYYRRGHIENALVGSGTDKMKKMKVILPNLDSIDYHFELDQLAEVNDTVIMSFRYQIFVTRSDVCLIEGLSKNQPHIVGLYSSLGGAK